MGGLRTEQNRTEQNRTEQNRTEQNRTEQNRTEQNRTEQNAFSKPIIVSIVVSSNFFFIYNIFYIFLIIKFYVETDNYPSLHNT